MKTISRIILTTDVLREPHLKVKSGAIGKNCLWFNTLFGSLIGEISDLPCEYYDFEYLSDFTKQLYKIYGFYEPLKETDWLVLYNEKEIKEEAIKLFEKYFSGSFVLGFELPQIFRKYFDELGISFIDVIHHPIRYLDDLMHGFSTNNMDLYLKLMKYQENPDLFKIKAIYEKTREVMRRGKNDIIPNSCVIFGQTQVDRSILKEDNTLAKLLDYKKEIKQLSEQYSHIYFKPHPANKDNQEVLDWFNKNIPNFSLLDKTYTYDLYSNPNIALYASLSSGTLYEAKYFGSKIKYFYKQPFLYGEDYMDLPISDYNYREVFVSINKDYLEFEFWSDVLSCLIKTKSKMKLGHLYLDNTLRYALGVSWGFCDNHYLSVATNKNAFYVNRKNILGFKDKIRYKVWKHLSKKLQKKGYINNS